MAGTVSGAARRRVLQAGVAGMAEALCASTSATAGVAVATRATLPQPERFSALQPGTAFAPAAERAGWRHRVLRGLSPNQFFIGLVDGEPCLQVEVNASASALLYRLDSSPPARVLRWRWRSDAFPKGAALGVRERDDFAARVYLMFDLPQSWLSVSDRLALGGASLIQGEPVPAATLVYLLHAGEGQDHVVRSPYSDRVAMIVARAGAKPDRWYLEARDWRLDFERTFGARYPGPIPAPSALAVAADGDQTGARLVSAFGDLEFAVTE